MRILEAIDFESDTSNWKYSFKILTKKYGGEFVTLIKAMWEANTLADSEFCKLNGLPIGFFNKIIKL